MNEPMYACLQRMPYISLEVEFSWKPMTSIYFLKFCFLWLESHMFCLDSLIKLKKTWTFSERTWATNLCHDLHCFRILCSILKHNTIICQDFSTWLLKSFLVFQIRSFINDLINWPFWQMERSHGCQMRGFYRLNQLLINWPKGMIDSRDQIEYFWRTLVIWEIAVLTKAEFGNFTLKYIFQSSFFM